MGAILNSKLWEANHSFLDEKQSARFWQKVIPKQLPQVLWCCSVAALCHGNNFQCICVRGWMDLQELESASSFLFNKIQQRKQCLKYEIYFSEKPTPRKTSQQKLRHSLSLKTIHLRQEGEEIPHEP